MDAASPPRRARTALQNWSSDFLAVLNSCSDPTFPTLAESTCTRRVTAEGALIEIVTLQGNGDELTAEQLEDFIASFPLTDA